MSFRRSFLRGSVGLDRLEIAGEADLAARLVIIREAPTRIDPAIAPLRILASLEPVGLPKAVAFQSVRPARLGDATVEARFNDCDRVGLVHCSSPCGPGEGESPCPRAVAQGLPFKYPRAGFAPYIGRARSLGVSFRQFRFLAALFRFQRGGLRLL